ncbi:MAG: hypothetical protein Q8930_15875, partial [Bacillota bacterium]|nr:hypothetical protein [Bacillota bacterium]
MSETYSKFNDGIRPITQQEFYKSLLYNTRRLVHELLDMRDRREILALQRNIPLVLLIIPVIYGITNYGRYKIIFSEFFNKLSFGSQAGLYNADIFFIALLIGAGLYLKYISGAIKALDKRIEELRTSLMKNITGPFCSHGGNCNCRQEFIQYMDEQEDT